MDLSGARGVTSSQRGPSFELKVEYVFFLWKFDVGIL